MTKSKEEYYSLAINSIQEISYTYNVNFDFTKLTKDKLSFGMSHNFKPDYTNDILSLIANVQYRYADNNEILAEYGILVNFKIPQLEELVTTKENSLEFEDKSLVMNLLNVTIGTLRGALFIKLRGTELEKYPLPLIPFTSLEKAMTKKQKP